MGLVVSMTHYVFYVRWHLDEQAESKDSRGIAHLTEIKVQ